MQNIRTNVTKRRIDQKNRDGKLFSYDRYILHYRDPKTKKRAMRRFKTRKEAEEEQNTLILNADELARRKTEPPKLKAAVEYWLKSREGIITPHTLKSYRQVARDYILGPFYVGTHDDRRQRGMTGRLMPKPRFVEMFDGGKPIDEISTPEIREWFQRVLEVATPYTARVARKHLMSIFKIVEEDFDFRLARIPSIVGQGYRRKPRLLFTEDQIKLVIEEAKRDKKWGVYYAFLIFTGVRPSEMLGLLWEHVNLERGRVLIYGSQDPNGKLKDVTKTDAGMREIPLNSLLYEMLLEWRDRCPRLHGELFRVFPSQENEDGRGRAPTETSDLGLSANNFRSRVWYPLLRRMGLPRVSLYALRHMAISYLQSLGVEIGLVAMIAGHATPEITLRYYTHAVRERPDVMDLLNKAYGVNGATRNAAQPEPITIEHRALPQYVPPALPPANGKNGS